MDFIGWQIHRLYLTRALLICTEKIICNCFRYRNKLELDIAKEGLSEYLKRKDRNLERQLEYAEICRVKALPGIWINAVI